MEKNPEQLLKQGQDLRETGQTLEAIDKFNQALDAFATDRNHAQFVHALLDRAICWQHLSQFHGNDFSFAVLFKKDAEAAIEIVEMRNIEKELATTLFMNAKAAMMFGDFDHAAEVFHKAISNMTPDRQAQRGDWQTNLGKALYLSGDKKSGLKTLLAGIEQIKKHSSEVTDYESRVWLTGGLMRLAEILATDKPEQASKYLVEAREIIESDPTLTVRQKQLENYLKTGITGL